MKTKMMQARMTTLLTVVTVILTGMIVAPVYSYKPGSWDYANRHDNHIYGNEGNNKLEGTPGRDNIYGQGGKDWLYGGMGDDLLDGGDGNDELFGNLGNDKIIGGKGDDVLYGCRGTDTYYYSRGDGYDIIYEDGNVLNKNKKDKVVLTDIPLEQVRFCADEYEHKWILFHGYTGGIGLYTREDRRGTVELLEDMYGEIVNLKKVKWSDCAPY